MDLQHIVVATDDSEAGRQAVRAGLDLARRASARVTVMRAVPVRAVPLMGAMAAPSETGELDAAGTALDALQRWLAAGVIPPGETVPVALGIAFGVPGIEICRFAEQRNADLLVLGRKRRSAMARLLVGDTADAVVRRSRVPCLFVQPDGRPLREVLVALDGSERGMGVLATAGDFARLVGARARAVTVEEEDASVEPAALVPLTRSSELERKVASRAVADPSRTHLTIRRGPVVRELLAEVAGGEADVLAFGYHRGGPPGIIEGSSTARQLAHAAPVSVLAIPL
jgi:nucleotide-binding universal stress UspA family protein